MTTDPWGDGTSDDRAHARHPAFVMTEGTSAMIALTAVSACVTFFAGVVGGSEFALYLGPVGVLTCLAGAFAVSCGGCPDEPAPGPSEEAPPVWEDMDRVWFGRDMRVWTCRNCGGLAKVVPKASGEICCPRCGASPDPEEVRWI